MDPMGNKTFSFSEILRFYHFRIEIGSEITTISMGKSKQVRGKHRFEKKKEKDEGNEKTRVQTML